MVGAAKQSSTVSANDSQNENTLRTKVLGLERQSAEQARLLNIEFSRLMAMNNRIDETKSEMYQVCQREQNTGVPLS